ncbi:transmembrane protease serine 9-like [Uranotaenia lowii]|uniref:transmembrane protease serine 9-like n=1 Tax=Uranotaenia lowii TaxID=190385 RepID=UPI0024784E39|nr:transmembrane protease serine 9-like [Uranotaenia lowii]
MKAFIVLALCAVSAYAGIAEDLWLEKNRILPEGLKDFVAPEYEGRIVGGHEVSIAQFPYQLSLRSNGNHICGASVISANWALSAAHCTFPMPNVNAITFRGGSASRLTGGVIFQAAQIINHPQYNNNNLHNDVCVIRITTSFVGANIAPITLVPSGTGFAAGTRSIVSGWGLMQQGGTLPVNLRAVDIPVVAQATCNNQWGGIIHASMVCAGEPGRDSCNGDSGGPLVTGGRQFGIVSWGATACGGPLPGVYANIGNAGVRSFISQHTGVYDEAAQHVNRLVRCSGFQIGHEILGEDVWKVLQMIPKAAKLVDADRSKNVAGLGKIIGGHQVDVSSFPYQLSLRSLGNHICGASVISRSWALTAAHCVYPLWDPSAISLRAGSSDRSFGGQIYNAAQIVIHPDYNPAMFDNDVALIRVTIPFAGEHVKAVQLVPAGYEPMPGIRSIVTGWGRTLTDDYLPARLNAVDVPIVARDTCALQWGTELVTDNMICAGQLGRDSCNGDSGGPLVSGGRQIGVVSWGSTNCGGPMPAVYTHLGRLSIRNFIKQVSGV